MMNKFQRFIYQTTMQYAFKTILKNKNIACAYQRER